jgi:hypothetical protein
MEAHSQRNYNYHSVIFATSRFIQNRSFSRAFGESVMTATLTAASVSMATQQPAYCQPQQLQQTIERILESGKIMEIDRQCLLKVALTDAPIRSQDAEQIRRIFNQLRMGLIRVV